MAALKITCPHCGTSLRLEEPYPASGSIESCRGCAHPLAITYPPGLIERFKKMGRRFQDAPEPAPPPSPKPEPPPEPPEPKPEPRLAPRPAPRLKPVPPPNPAGRWHPGRRETPEPDEPDPFRTRLPPGSALGEYIIESRIGTGGMATVYRARHRILENPCAIKVLHPHLLEKRDARLRFLEEGKIQARLKHPHIVWVFGVVTEPDIAGLVMEWLDGADLASILQESGPIPPRTAVDWAIQALSALSHVHAAGVVHRDLKPENLFIEETVTGERRLRLMDFGIAKVLGQSRTQTGIQMGTFAYMSPEQVRSSRDIDHRSDIFAMGAILYELLEGRPAFDPTLDASPVGIIHRITTGRFEPHRVTRSAALQGIVARALSLERADRFPDAAAFQRALEQVRP
jgi:serine/threonine protein kinase